MQKEKAKHENIFITSYIPIYFSYLKNLKPLTRSMGKNQMKIKKKTSAIYISLRMRLTI